MRKIPLLIILALICGCTQMSVPNESKWGIYLFDLNYKSIELIYPSNNELVVLSFNQLISKIAFSMKISSSEEIFTINVNGSGLKQLTDNDCLDTYPSWSPDGSKIIYLSMCNETLDIRLMNADGSNNSLFYDSGYHDADINWADNSIVFTRNSQVWIIDSNAGNARQLTNQARAGEWGNANLPFGDYDPRLSPDGLMIVFERLVNDSSVYGNYDLFIINSQGSEEKQLTYTGYSQGMASWSPSADKLVYLVAAINDTGLYRMYLINPDGSGNQDITPSYFKPNFLCHSPVFIDENRILFIGEW